MRIGIDSRPMYGRPAGIGLYVRNLIENLKSIKSLDLVEFGPKSPRVLWHFNTYLSLVFSKKVDYYLSTHSYLIPCLPYVKSVLVVHDLSVCLFPGEYPFKLVILTRLFLKLALYRTKHIIVPSQATKDDLVKLFGVSPDKVSVIYHGVEFSGKKAPLPNNLMKSPFCLFVGTIQPRKNLVLLIEAFASLANDYGGKPKLVICGEKGWKYEEVFEAVEKLNLKNRVIFLGYVSEAEKFTLFKNAAFLVLPSLYEGFGLPAVEAFYSGCPVVCSNIGALSEIGGDAALYFNPRKKEELEAQMKKVFDWYFRKDKEYKNLVEKGKTRASLFSWEKTARETFEVFKKVK